MAKDVNDPLFDPEPQHPLMRILPALVLICSIGGFAALGVYAYRAGSQSVNEGELVVIEADKTPMKEKPEDPGGMQFPNQDKTIFETFSGEQKPAQVERVLPTPEEPIAQEGGANWTNDKLASAPAKDVPPAQAAPQGAEQVFGDDVPAKVVQPHVLNVQEELAKKNAIAPVVAELIQEASPAAAKPVELTTKAEQKAAAKVAPKVEAPKVDTAAVPKEEKKLLVTEEKTVITQDTVMEPAKQDVQEVPVAEVATVAKPVSEKPVAKVEAKKVEKPKTSGGKGLVQLGAYKSEDEARGDFAKIQKKHSALAGKSPIINRADLDDKGIFFRLRVATDDAKGLCSKLSAAGQACMAVK